MRLKNDSTPALEKNKLIAYVTLSDRMENPINQGPMHISGVYCTRQARLHHCDHAMLVRAHCPTGPEFRP
jgi:hypothetical protein